MNVNFDKNIMTERLDLNRFLRKRGKSFAFQFTKLFARFSLFLLTLLGFFKYSIQYQ